MPNSRGAVVRPREITVVWWTEGTDTVVIPCRAMLSCVEYRSGPGHTISDAASAVSSMVSKYSSIDTEPILPAIRLQSLTYLMIDFFRKIFLAP